MEKNKLDRNSEEYRGLFSRYLARGHNGLTDVEARALSEGSSTGGAVLFPTTYSNMFMEELGDDEILGKVSKVYSSAGTFSVPVITPIASGGFSVQKNPGEAGTLLDATASGQTTVTVPTIANPGTGVTGSSTSTFTLKRISVMVKVSQELLEDSASLGEAGVESFIIRQASQDIISQLNKQILVGNKDDSVTAGTASTVGSDACHGVFNTCRRYSRSYTTATVGGSLDSSLIRSNLQSFVFGYINSAAMPVQYWRRGTMVLNSQLGRNNSAPHGTNLISAVNAQSAIVMGTTDRFMFGIPWTLSDMTVSNSGTATISSSNEPMAVLCDFSRYLLAFAGNGISVTRVNETYAATNEAAFIVSVRCAGALTDVNAAIALQLA
jgi:predicted phage gp36 major capsid-like protein